MKFRFLCLGLIDEFGQAIHLFFACRDDAGGLIGFVDDTGFGLAADEVDDFGKDGRGIA